MSTSDTIGENSPELWLGAFPIPKTDGHKYDRGHALVYGGPMTGAARLAARAAQRVGAGLVTVAADAKHSPIYAQALESIIVRECVDIKAWEGLLADPKRNAILIGPGLGPDPVQKLAVLAALETKKLCVLDAEALTGFAEQPADLFKHLHKNCILTPHEGEFGRLFGAKVDLQADKVSRAVQAATLAGCAILLKGAETIIVQPGQKPIINRNAPPWLATAGSGDVLAGMILGLGAQQMPLFKAVAAAAWLHGEVAIDFGFGLIAEDLISGLAAVLQRVITRN